MQFRFLYDCLHDAFEIVNWRNGDIRDKEIAQWYLEEMKKAIARAWRLKKAVLNGNKDFTDAIEALLSELITNDEDMRKPAQSLLCILKNTIQLRP